jgi:hypothetical protein
MDLVKNNFPKLLFLIGLTQWAEIFPSTLRQAQGERKNFNRSISGSY